MNGATIPTPQSSLRDDLSFSEYASRYKASIMGHALFLLVIGPLNLFFILERLGAAGTGLLIALHFLPFEGMLRVELSIALSLINMITVIISAYHFFNELEMAPSKKAVHYHAFISGIGIGLWLFYVTFLYVSESYFYYLLRENWPPFLISELIVSVLFFLLSYVSSRFIITSDSSPSIKKVTLIFGFTSITAVEMIPLFQLTFIFKLIPLFQPAFFYVIPLFAIINYHLLTFSLGGTIYGYRLVTIKTGVPAQVRMTIKTECQKHLLAGNIVNVLQLSQDHQIPLGTVMKLTRQVQQELLQQHRLEVLTIDHLLVPLPTLVNQAKSKLENAQPVNISEWAQSMGVQPLSLVQALNAMLMKGFLGNAVIQGWELHPSPSTREGHPSTATPAPDTTLTTRPSSSPFPQTITESHQVAASSQPSGLQQPLPTTQPITSPSSRTPVPTVPAGMNLQSYRNVLDVLKESFEVVKKSAGTTLPLIVGLSLGTALFYYFIRFEFYLFRIDEILGITYISVSEDLLLNLTIGAILYNLLFELLPFAGFSALAMPVVYMAHVKVKRQQVLTYNEAFNAVKPYILPFVLLDSFIHFIIQLVADISIFLLAIPIAIWWAVALPAFLDIIEETSRQPMRPSIGQYISMSLSRSKQITSSFAGFVLVVIIVANIPLFLRLFDDVFLEMLFSIFPLGLNFRIMAILISTVDLFILYFFTLINHTTRPILYHELLLRRTQLRSQAVMGTVGMTPMVTNNSPPATSTSMMTATTAPSLPSTSSTPSSRHPTSSSPQSQAFTQTVPIHTNTQTGTSTTTCPRCNSSVISGAAFCHKCGLAFASASTTSRQNTIQCKACNKIVPDTDAKFCVFCGTKL